MSKNLTVTVWICSSNSQVIILASFDGIRIGGCWKCGGNQEAVANSTGITRWNRGTNGSTGGTHHRSSSARCHSVAGRRALRQEGRLKNRPRRPTRHGQIVFNWSTLTHLVTLLSSLLSMNSFDFLIQPPTFFQIWILLKILLAFNSDHLCFLILLLKRIQTKWTMICWCSTFQRWFIYISTGWTLFLSQQDVVKLQILNLASKLCLSNPKQTKVLCQYVFRYVQEWNRNSIIIIDFIT